MKNSSLASSRRAWKFIQSLLSRVVTNGKEYVFGNDDVISAAIKAPDFGHSFKVTRDGNKLRMQKGLVGCYGNGTTAATWVMSDNGGFNINSFPCWVTIRITVGANPPYSVTNEIETYYVVQAGGQTVAPIAEISLPIGDFGNYSITEQSVSDGSLGVPVAYVTEDAIYQLVKANLSISIEANHHNLFYFI